jgi:hypothetical protein
VIDLIKKQNLKEIVGIRGLNLFIEDLEFEQDTVETVMWNPMHFAVYYNNFELVKHFVSVMKVNANMTLPKANAESEKDSDNTEKY